MIAEHDAAHGQASRHGEFEGVAFHFAGDGAEDGEARLGIVAGMAQDDRGASALPAPGLPVDRTPASPERRVRVQVAFSLSWRENLPAHIVSPVSGRVKILGGHLRQ